MDPDEPRLVGREGDESFSTVLRAAMKRPTHDVTPGWLSKISGIPKATIVNWLEGRVGRPRSDASLRSVCEALRLTADERANLFAAAGTPLPDPAPEDGLCDVVPIGLYRTTPDGRILYANRTIVEMLGYDDRERYRMLDVTHDLYAFPEHRSAWIADLEAAGTLRRVPTWARRADGSRLLVLDSATAVRDRTGTVLYFEGAWEPA